MKTEKSDKGGKFGLKRLGTVIRGRRQSTNPYTQSRSPERKKSSSDVRSSPFSRFGRKESSHQPLETVPSPPQTAHSTFEDPPGSRSADAPPQLEPIPSLTSTGVNGTSSNLQTVNEQENVPTDLTNGTQNQLGVLQEPLQPSPVYEPPKDEHGFTIPPPNRQSQDPMQQALAEAAESVTFDKLSKHQH